MGSGDMCTLSSLSLVQSYSLFYLLRSSSAPFCIPSSILYFHLSCFSRVVETYAMLCHLKGGVRAW